MNKSTILVVDDDEAILDSLRMSLEAVGYAVRTYRSGTAFLKDRSEPPGSLLLLDLHMPELNGLEVQARLKRSARQLPVIMITAKGDVRSAVRAMQLGAFDFIEKPLDGKAVLHSIARALSSEKRVSQSDESTTSLPAGYNRLTAREREVLGLLAVGESNKSIALELGISPRTVEIHRARVMEKLEARNLADLVRMALTAGIGP